MNVLKKIIAWGALLTGVALSSYAATRLLTSKKSPAGGTTQTAQTAQTRYHVPLVAKWEVRYRDSQAGMVQGIAVVNWEKDKATVIFDDADGKKAILTANDVAIVRNEMVTMRLRGKGPYESPETPKPPEGIKTVAASGGQTFSVQPAEPKFSAEIQDKSLPDHDGVSLTLQADSYGALAGEWSYRADPITQRNASGGGRVGYYRLLNDEEIDDPHAGFLGEQRSEETWWPLPAEIVCVLPLENQLAASQRTFADYAYPGPGRTDPKFTHRTLFVVGRNFPVDADGRTILQDPASGGFIIPRVVAVSTDPSLDDKTKERFEEGWKSVLQLLDPETAAIARESLDAAIINAELRPNVMPGPHYLTWGEGSNAYPWLLQFGDNRAEAHIVRAVRHKTDKDPTSKDEFEITKDVFLPETVQIEIRPRVNLPIDTIPVHVAAATLPANAALRPDLGPAGMPQLSAPLTLEAKRIPAHYPLFRTGPITLTNGGTTGGTTLALRPGSGIFATVAMDDVAFIAPPVGSAAVYLTPDQISPAQPQQPPKTPSTAEKIARGLTGIVRAIPATVADSTRVRLWEDALRLAGDADNKKVEDFNTLAGQTVTSYQGIRVTVAEHAAMLLLRATFVSMLEEQLQQLQQIKSDEQVEAFREWVRPFMDNSPPLVPPEDPPIGWTGPHEQFFKEMDGLNKLRLYVMSLPAQGVKKAISALNTRERTGFGSGTYFGELSVPGPGSGSGSWEYFTTYWSDNDNAYKPFFKDNPTELHKWRLRATRSAIEQFTAAAGNTLEETKRIRTGDTKALIKLTGYGFGPVVTRLIPQLMRLDDTGGGPTAHWVPNPVARPAVENLHQLAEAARKAEDYSDLALRSTIEIVTAALTWSGYLGIGGTALQGIEHVANWGLLAWQVGSEVYDQVFVVRPDVDFFFGASGVLGADRLEEVNARKASIGDVVEQLATDWAVNNVWGELKDTSSPVKVPQQGALRFRLPFVEVPVLAADAKPPQPRKIRSFGQRILQGLGALSTGRVLGTLGQLTKSDLAQWPKRQLQAFLQQAGIGGARIEQGGPVTRVQAKAAAQARRLAAQPGAAAPAAQPGGQPAQPAAQQPANVGKAGLGGLAAPKAPVAPEPVGPYFPIYGRYAYPHEYPITGTPPMYARVLAIKENGKWVYYLTEKFDPDTKKPGTLGSGATSEVYPIVQVRGRPEGKLLEGEGAVIKIIKDHRAWGSAQEQIGRIKRSYEQLKAARASDPRIGFPDILWDPLESTCRHASLSIL